MLRDGLDARSQHVRKHLQVTSWFESQAAYHHSKTAASNVLCGVAEPTANLSSTLASDRQPKDAWHWGSEGSRFNGRSHVHEMQHSTTSTRA